MPAHNESESSSRHGTLILTRSIGEVIVIGDDTARVVVLGVKGNQVRLGITADKDTPVHREEIYNRIKSGAKAPR